MALNQNIGVVVKADGTVPFDAGVPDEVKAHILKHLVDKGHSPQPVTGTPHYKIPGWNAKVHGAAL